MHVIEVIPLKRGVHVESLTYFSSISYPLGTLLSVPIRNSETKAVVSAVREVSTTKTALRAATFSLKKLPVQTETQALSPALMRTAEELAAHYATKTGAVLYALLAPEIRSGEIPFPHTHHVDVPEPHTPEVHQGTAEERYITYRSLVRETFSHSGSLLFVVPSAAEVDEAHQILSAGISDRVVTLSSTMTKRGLRASYELLEDFTKPKLIIATPSYAMLERHDITTVIVEKARSINYKERTRPYLDSRDALITHATQTGRRIVLGDLLPRTEEEGRRRMDRFDTLGETPKRLSLPGTLSLIHQKDTPEATVPFRLFSPKVIEAIKDAKKRKEKVFLLAARRGLAPAVACGDCGYIFRSQNAGTPYSLVRTRRGNTEERWFVCSVSGQRERAADTCPECGSWRLRERGIGIQHAYDELSRELDGAPIILFDHTNAKSAKRARFLQETFYKTKGAVMLGTPMAIPYLTRSIDTSVVVNLDALRATPTWRQQEDNLALLLQLRELTHGKVYVQTRSGSDDIIEHAKRGSVERFYDEEIELRKTFNYPPYTVFIHLTWQGNKATVADIEADVKTTLGAYISQTNFYNAPPTPKGGYIQYALIRFPAVDWPDEGLVAALRQLPPSVRIILNPDRIV